MLCLNLRLSMLLLSLSYLCVGNSYWPLYKAQAAVDKAVKESEKPKATWNKYPVSVMFLSCKCI